MSCYQCCDADAFQVDASATTDAGVVPPAVRVTNSAGHQHDTVVKSMPADAEAPSASAEPDAEPVSKPVSVAAIEATAETVHGAAAGEIPVVCAAPGTASASPPPPPQRESVSIKTSKVRLSLIDKLMPEDAPGRNIGTLQEAEGERRGGRKRYTQIEMSTETFDAAEVLGEKFADPGPSLWSVLLHAMMHKPLIIFIPAIPAALWMYAMACFPHCAITEEEVPLSGALGLSRWGEWGVSRVILGMAMIGCASLGTALADVNMMDRYAYGAAFFFHAIPFFLMTGGLVMASGCDTSDQWLVIYITVGEGFVGTTTYMLLSFLAVNRMRGMENWWNPMNIRKRSIKGLVSDMAGFLYLSTGMVLAILYIAIDVAFIATSPLKGLRPVFTMFLKKFCYVMASQGFRRLGNTFKIWGLITLSAVLGLNTAFAAVQCNSWESLGMFIILDLVSFSSRIWCHSGRLNNTRLGYYYRRYLLFGKSSPPDGIPTPVYRGFEIVVEGLGLSIGFATMMCVFFLSDPRISPYPNLRNMCFPYGWQSFYYLLAMQASDFVQDVAGVVWVAHRIRYDFSKLLGHPFAYRNRPFILCQTGGWWAMVWLVQFGWLFQRLQVGPFAPGKLARL